jgi:hypothetical protein
VTGPAARVPLIAGVEPGVGTSTLAAALHAEDGGLLGQEADVVVCGSAAPSLRAAAEVICPGRGPRPVLAIVVDPVAGPVSAPLPPVLSTRFATIVQIPHVHGWDGHEAPDEEAAAVLAETPDQLDPTLRPYSAALRAVVAALVDSGQLSRGTPPMVIRPLRGRERVSRPEPGYARATPGRHRLRAETPIADRPAAGYAEQDDETIEAHTLAAERRAPRSCRRAG